MKNIYSFLLLIAMPLFAVSCSSDGEKESQGVLNIVNADTSFDFVACEGQIEVFAAGAEVTAVPDRDWCEATVSGNIITLKLAKNDNTFSRIARIQISANGVTRSVPIIQQKLVFGLVYSEEDLTYSFDGGSSVITVINSSTEPVVIKTDDNWISYSLTGDQLEITAQPNSGTRTGYLHLTVGHIPLTIPIVQSIPNYSYYLGTFTMTYTNDMIDEESMTVTLTQKTAGSSYTMSADNWDYDIEVAFRKSDGALVVSPQRLDRGYCFYSDSTEDIYLGLWGTSVGMSAPTNSAGAALKGTLGKRGDQDTVVFSDGGGWNMGPLDCFNFAYFDNDGDWVFDYYNTVNFEAMFFNVTMVKQ